ncbi:MAG: hypothetical protein J0I12_28770 [Candidatus Eremiobacteraeota bacterium]|nr:hypothetical protein [Candidatus Eremiobacteraeota bacterium]
MLTARLYYQYLPDQEYVYVRTMQMQSDPPPLQGLVITQQTWKRLEERDGLTMMQVQELVRERGGPLSQPFQAPPGIRKVYLDACGLMPKGDEEFAALSPFPVLSEDSLDEGEEWECTEVVPNSAEPMDIVYRLEEYRPEGDELWARLSSHGQTPELEVRGHYEFSVSRGLLKHGQLQVVNRLPDGQTVTLQVDLALAD